MIKHFLRIAILLSVLMVLLNALSLKTAGAQTITLNRGLSQNQFKSSSNGMWSVVPSPNGDGNSGLSAIAAVSANDIWAVGNVSNPTTRTQTTLTEVWNGTLWQIVPSPNPSMRHNTLYGVSAVSTSDAWAVGFYANTSEISQTLIEHWNGINWQVVPSPSPGSVNNELFSVAAVSAHDVWAVGFTANDASVQTTLIEHWNGSRWRIVPSPNSSSIDVLSGVAAVSSSDVWAVGTSNMLGETLIEHWNGARWQIVSSPASSGELRAVAASSNDDVWAVGDSPTGSGGASLPLIEHWNGTSWQAIDGPQVGAGSLFSAVTAASATDVWAVGSNGGGSAFFQTLIEHWNGSSWKVVPSPSPGSFSSQLLGVEAISTTDIWAVGYADSNTLIEHN